MTAKKRPATKKKELLALLREDADALIQVAEDVAKHPEKYPDQILVLGPEQVREVFTAERARLLETLRKRGSVESVSDLAELLHRAISRVSADLTILEKHGLVHIERAGRAKRVSAQQRAILVW